jgi:hypothetical protein
MTIEQETLNIQQLRTNQSSNVGQISNIDGLSGNMRNVNLSD